MGEIAKKVINAGTAQAKTIVATIASDISLADTPYGPINFGFNPDVVLGFRSGGQSSSSYTFSRFTITKKTTNKVDIAAVGGAAGSLCLNADGVHDLGSGSSLSGSISENGVYIQLGNGNYSKIAAGTWYFTGIKL